jgi:replicative DNA helicase
MTFEERIEEGLSGQYKGLANGLTRINNYIFNVQRACYTLIGGLSGSAKTKYIDFTLINALKDAEVKNIPINVFYYSYEIDEFTKKADWLSMLIYNKYNMIISPEKIKGLGEFRLDDREKEIVEELLPELNRLFNKITWRWESSNPTGLYKEWWTHMSSRGTFERESYVDEHDVTKERIVKFTLTNPDEYNLVIIDHLALMRIEKRDGKTFTLKENIDKLSEYAVRCRNLFKMTFFLLQQFNQGLNSVDRQKFKGVDITPQQSDFKDTTNPYTDADVVLGLLNAHKMDMETCLKYNINKPMSNYNLKDRFRMLKIVKNRLSRDGIAIGLLFLPEACYFEELSPPDRISESDIERYEQLVNNR